MIQRLAEVLNGTVHGDVILADNFIIRCTMTGKVKASHTSKPGTFTVGTMQDSVETLGKSFQGQSWLHLYS